MRELGSVTFHGWFDQVYQATLLENRTWKFQPEPPKFWLFLILPKLNEIAQGHDDEPDEEYGPRQIQLAAEFLDGEVSQ